MQLLLLDIASIIIALILMLSMFLRKMTRGRTNFMFIMMLVFIIGPAFLDCWSEAYGLWLPEEPESIPLRMGLCYLYYLMRNFSPLLYQLVIFTMTDTWHIQMKTHVRRIILFTPYAISCLVLLLNSFTHVVFYYDAAMNYHRGPLISLLYINSFIYLIYGICYVIKYKKVLATDKFWVLLLTYPLNILAVAIQLLYTEIYVEMFVTSLSVLLMALVIQRPEEFLNPTLGVKNSIAYSTDIERADYLDKTIGVILVKIVNYPSIVSIIDSHTVNHFMKLIVGRMASSVREHHLHGDLYYLERGLFAIVAEKPDFMQLEFAARKIGEELNGTAEFACFDLELETCVSVVRCPEDINTSEALMSFSNSFHNYLPSGKDVSVVAYEKGNRDFRLKRDIDIIVSAAIAERKFEMYYQPIYSVKEDRFVSAEALIRLNDENYGFVPPAFFIAAAERTGTILQIGDFVLDDVCRFVAELSREGIELDFAEINLSMIQCTQTNLERKVLSYLKKYGVNPAQINFEITESTADSSTDIVDVNMRKLTEAGITFSLDDYGTGYSNTSRILELPFRIVKLDKSLVSKVSDSRMYIMLKSTIRAMKDIGMEIVVEGVEDEEALKLFTDLECDYIQGYYFSKPLPEKAFIEFMKSNR